jgi:hypothetical protein
MNLLALGTLAVFAALIALFLLAARRRGARPPALREIEAFQRLPGTVGLAVETGRRLHLSLGSGVVGQAETATTLAGLMAVGRIASDAVVSDKPPVITTADGTAMLLAQDVLRQEYREQNALERFESTSARVAGLSPMAFGAALAPLVKDELVAGNVIIGPAGAEALLLAEAGRRAGVPTLAGTDNLSAQAALFAAADDALLGEDVFAGAAYLGRAQAHIASLRAQDVMRVLVILVILAGTVAKTLGLLP